MFLNLIAAILKFNLFTDSTERIDYLEDYGLEQRSHTFQHSCNHFPYHWEIYFIKVSVAKFESPLSFGIVKNNRIKIEINAQEVHIYHSLNKRYTEQQ